MPFTHKSRTGKTYYLHTGPKRGGGLQYFFSSKAAGQLADRLPDGFEAYETVNGQVYLRRIQPKMITDEEIACIQRGVATPRKGSHYKVEVLGKVI